MAAITLSIVFTLIACSSPDETTSARSSSTIEELAAPALLTQDEHADLWGGFRAKTTMPLLRGATGTFGGFFLTNQTDEPIELESVHPNGADSTMVPSIHVTDLNVGETAVGTADVFPPLGVHLQPAEGHEIAPDGHLSVIFEVRRSRTASDPADVFNSVTIHYRRGGDRYETTIDQALTLVDPPGGDGAPH